MRRRILNCYIIGLLGVLLLASCYRDKGNYSYKALNEISFDMPDDVSAYQGEVLYVEPKMTFALENNEENLSYEWVISVPSAEDSVNVVLSTERNFTGVIDYSAGNTYPFRFFVTDNNTGVTYVKKMNLLVRTSFSPGYFVVEQYNDHSDFSFYNTELDTVIHNAFSTMNPDIVLPPTVTDMYSIDYNGYTVNAGDVATRYEAGNMTMLFGEDWGYVIDFRSSKVSAAIDQMFSTRPDVIRPQVLASEQSPNFFLMNDGIIYRLKLGEGQTLFGDPLVVPDAIDYECAPFIGKGINVRGGVTGVLFYDELNNRGYSITPSTGLELYVAGAVYTDEVTGDTIVDMKDVPDDWELVGFTQGGMTDVYYWMMFDCDDAFRVVQWGITGSYGCPVNVVDEVQCPGMRESRVFASSFGRNQVYYANGNEIRLYDVAANNSRVVYTFPAGEEIVSMVFPTRTTSADLAVATNNGENGTLYTFTISGTGDLQDPEPTKKVSGFGKIKKIVYKN